MLRNITVYLLLSLSMMTILADESLPLLEFIKDGEVIESRAMTQEEFAAYKQLKSLELNIEQAREPIEQFQKLIEQETQLIEQEAREIQAQLKEIRFESMADLSQLSVLGDIDMTKIEQMLDEMQPKLDALTSITAEIGTTTSQFKTIIMKNYSEKELDQIKIIDGADGKITIGRSTTNITL